MTDLIIPTAYLVMFMITIYFLFITLRGVPLVATVTILLVGGLMWPLFLPVAIAKLRCKITDAKTPRVLIILEPNGEYEIMQSHGVDVFFVSDHTPYDRVYKWSTFHTDAQIDAVLGDSPHGHIDDSSAAQIRAHRAAKIIDGGCHLSTAENGDGDD